MILSDKRFHELLIEGTEAEKDGKPIEANPYKLADYRAAWERGWRAHLTQLEIGPGQTGLDEEIAELVWAMNKLPGIKTTCSCCGHGQQPMMIWFDVTDFNERGFLTLSRLLSHNYYGAFAETFRIVLDHKDTQPQVFFRLEGAYHTPEYQLLAAWAWGEKLAAEINAHVEDTVKYYNILYDRRRT